MLLLKLLYLHQKKEICTFPKEIPHEYELFYTYEGSKPSFYEIKSFVDTQLDKTEAYFQIAQKI